VVLERIGTARNARLFTAEIGGRPVYVITMRALGVGRAVGARGDRGEYWSAVAIDGRAVTLAQALEQRSETLALERVLAELRVTVGCPDCGTRHETQAESLACYTRAAQGSA